MYYEELCFHLCVQILRSSRARLPGARWPSMYCCSRLRLNERLHTHCSMFSVRCSVYIVHVLSILATLRAHCLMFNVCCLMFALGSSMRDCGWIVHKRSILHALMPSFPQSHHWIHAKTKDLFVRTVEGVGWPIGWKIGGGAVWQVQFPSLFRTPPPPWSVS